MPRCRWIGLKWVRMSETPAWETRPTRYQFAGLTAAFRLPRWIGNHMRFAHAAENKCAAYQALLFCFLSFFYFGVFKFTWRTTPPYEVARFVWKAMSRHGLTELKGTSGVSDRCGKNISLWRRPWHKRHDTWLGLTRWDAHFMRMVNASGNIWRGFVVCDLGLGWHGIFYETLSKENFCVVELETNIVN